MPQRSRHVLMVVDIFLSGKQLGNFMVSGSTDEKQADTTEVFMGGRTTPWGCPQA